MCNVHVFNIMELVIILCSLKMLINIFKQTNFDYEQGPAGNCREKERSRREEFA